MARLPRAALSALPKFVPGRRVALVQLEIYDQAYPIAFKPISGFADSITAPLHPYSASLLRQGLCKDLSHAYDGMGGSSVQRACVGGCCRATPDNKVKPNSHVRYLVCGTTAIIGQQARLRAQG